MQVGFFCIKKITTGKREEIQNEIRIFPNPVTICNISIEYEQALQKLLVWDVTGRMVTSMVPILKQTVVECNWP